MVILIGLQLVVLVGFVILYHKMKPSKVVEEVSCLTGRDLRIHPQSREHSGEESEEKPLLKDSGKVN